MQTRVKSVMQLSHTVYSHVVQQFESSKTWILSTGYT